MKHLLLFQILFFIICSIPHISFSSDMVITYRSPESETDLRYEYDKALLKLAMEKTKVEYGPYKMQPSGVMNYARATKFVTQNTFDNFFIKQSYQDNFSDNFSMDYVPFPVDLGIVGYRVCFVHRDIKEKLLDVQNLVDLKKFTHGQGIGWSDVDILQHNDFKVVEIGQYESLFNMVTAKRFDLFCRGTNELLDEYNAHKHLKNFTYDTSFSLAYPMPRFFYTHKSNRKALERVTKGLTMAYNDGSLEKLWLDKYKKSIDFVQLGKRKIFYIENPFLKNLDFDYQQYFYTPISIQDKKDN